MIADLTPFLTHPIGEEISLALMTFISIFLMLWLLSQISDFKKRDFKTALAIAAIIALISFLIRSISLIFGLKDPQKPPINISGMVIENIILIILIKKVYDLKWIKTILIWLATAAGRLMIGGIITLIVLFFFTSIPAQIAERSSEFGTLEEIQNRTNFEIMQPSYLPAGYYLDNAQSPKGEMGNYVDLHYFRKDGSVTFVIALGEKLLEEEPNLQLVSPPGEEIMINENSAIIAEGPYDDLGITWYSKNLKLLFSLRTGINGGLDKDELIRIAESISK